MFSWSTWNIYKKTLIGFILQRAHILYFERKAGHRRGMKESVPGDFDSKEKVIKISPKWGKTCMVQILWWVSTSSWMLLVRDTSDIQHSHSHSSSSPSMTICVPLLIVVLVEFHGVNKIKYEVMTGLIKLPLETPLDMITLHYEFIKAILNLFCSSSGGEGWEM